MIRSFRRLLVVGFLATCLVPLVTADCTHYNNHKAFSARFLALNVLILVAVGIAVTFFTWLLKRLDSHFDSDARNEAAFLDTLGVRYLNLAIFGSAALSLFLELA